MNKEQWLKEGKEKLHAMSDEEFLEFLTECSTNQKEDIANRLVEDYESWANAMVKYEIEAE